eukprot:SAG25_NODE_6_length_29267_cov_21.188803_10_plen_51_part_00
MQREWWLIGLLRCCREKAAHSVFDNLKSDKSGKLSFMRFMRWCACGYYRI